MDKPVGIVNNQEDKWGWVVATACFGINFIILGLQRSAAIVYVALLAEFGITREQAAWPITLCSSIMFLVGPLAGFLAEFLIIRTIVFSGCLIASIGVILCFFGHSLVFIILFFGAVQGFGNGLVITLNPVIINQYFKKHKATASGIAYAGASVGSIALPPFTEYLLDEYNLRGCFLLLGGIILQGLVAASLYRPPKSVMRKIGNVPEIEQLVKPQEQMDSRSVELSSKSKNFFDGLRGTLDVITHPYFLIICVNYTSFFICYIAFAMVFVDFSLDRGIEESNATFCISAFSVGDLFGRLFTGWLSDFGYIKTKYLVTVNLLTMGILFLIFPIFSSYVIIVILSILIGLLTGCILIIFPVLMTEYLGLQRLAMAMGFSGFTLGCTSLALPNLIGIFRDIVGTYDHLFHTLGLMAITSSLLWLLQPIYKICKKKLFI
ncbi:monocarboxylate transporter 2-like isoform X1 [Centruroides sculpturatus]|uniref:monocarboxylate transporter 2-like isoform X1 n=1 Tax=Centruroides sculpturatus TaxID=218467 RepID=UPI000C6E3090|nr:monocarboxylate transporter 2-like isoform X1 [Centruroides sculpturatus]